MRVFTALLHVWRVALWLLVLRPLVWVWWAVTGTLMLSWPDITLNFPGAYAELDEWVNGPQKNDKGGADDAGR